MSLIQAMNNALGGLKAVDQKLNKTAANIAQYGASEPEAMDRMPEDFVDLKLAKTAHEANLATFKKVQEMEKSLIDIIV